MFESLLLQPKTTEKLRAPLASPEQSGLAGTPATSPSVEGTSGGEVRLSNSKRRKRGISSDADVDLKLNSKGESALHRAAMKNDVDQLKRLLTAGLSSNVRDHAGWTPLHEAALRGHVEVSHSLSSHLSLITALTHFPMWFQLLNRNASFLL